MSLQRQFHDQRLFNGYVLINGVEIVRSMNEQDLAEFGQWVQENYGQ